MTNWTLKFVLICATLSVFALTTRQSLLGKETAAHLGTPATSLEANQAVQNNQALSKHQTAQNEPPQALSVEAIAHFKRAEAYRNVLETDSGIHEYTLALELEPHFDRAHLGRALSYLESEDYRSAIADLEQVAKTSPFCGQALDLAAMAHYHLKEYAAAKANYDNMLRLKEYVLMLATYHKYPDFKLGGVFANRAQCLVMLNMPEAAIKDCSMALTTTDKRNLQRGWALRARARAYTELHQYDAAIADYTDALQLVKLRKDRGFVQTLGGALTGDSLLQERAKLYDEVGKHDLARKDLAEAKGLAGTLYGDLPFRLHDK